MNSRIKRTLMIIDDDRDDIYFFIKAVKKIDEPFDCISAEGGVNALEQLELMTRLPDFIFLDLNMPCLNGRACIKALKANSRFRDIPVIIYSTSASETDIGSLKNAGAAYYLSKPMDTSLLPALILEAITSVRQSVII